jgi:polyprenyl-phospho-N-acetylgalactosaminyl synthase
MWRVSPLLAGGRPSVLSLSPMASETGPAEMTLRTPAPLAEAWRRRVFVVIAAFNEARSLGEVVRELLPVCPNVIVVDDGSSDETWQVAHAAGAVVLRHFLNRGQGAALQTGISYALLRGAEVIVTFDADGQHRPEDIPALVEPIAQGEVEICLGSRFLEHGDAVPLGRRALLMAAIVFMRITSGLKLSDAHNGLRAFSRRAASGFDIQLDRMAHASEFIDQVRASGLPYKEVAVRVRYTDYSRAKGQRSTAALRVAFDYLIGRLIR